MYAFDTYNMQTNEKVFKTLNSVAIDTDHIPVVFGVDSYNLCLTGDKGRTLATPSGGLNEHIPVVCFEPGIMSRDCSAGNRAYENICSTLRARMGDNQPAVCYTMNERQISMMVQENKANTIAATDYKGVQILCYEEDKEK